MDKTYISPEKIIMSLKSEFFLPLNGSHDIFQQLKHKQPAVFTVIGEKLLVCGIRKVFFCSFNPPPSKILFIF